MAGRALSALEPLRMGLVTDHLAWCELRCHDGTEVPEELTENAQIVADAFEAVRALWDRPITVLSGYRTPAYNQAVGGAPGSYHVRALALDLQPPEGVSVVDFWSDICDLALRTTIRGIGYASPQHGNFVHIDCRPSAVVHHWRYPLR